MHHWTDSKIYVHGFYCTIALLLRALIFRRVRNSGIRLSMKRVFKELDGIREVVNIYAPSFPFFYVYAKINLSPFGFGMGSPNSLAVSIHN